MRPRMRFGDFVLEPALQRLARGGAIVRLKPKAYDLLCLLLDNRDRVVSKKELMEWLWPRQDIYEANLLQTVYELRRALGDATRRVRWIENVPRRGYRFVGEVELLTQPREVPGMPASIAVLPFRPLVAEPSAAQLGLGITEGVITALASLGRMVVRPTSAILRYLHMDGGALQAGSDLRVEGVLEGDFQQLGDAVRVNARLLRVPGGTTLWAGDFSASSSDIITLHEQISGALAQGVELRLTSEERIRLGRRHTADPEVHDLYMQGRYCWRRWTPEAWRQAEAFFREAIERQANHAPSHAGLASALCTLGIFGALAPGEAFGRARAAAARAVALDPHRPEGHEILGAIALFHDWDTLAALRHLDAAIELVADGGGARHLRALALATGEHHAQALAEIHQAIHADPHSLIARTDLGFIHYWARRHEQALAALEATLRLDPNFGHARMAMGWVLNSLGRIDEALVQVERGLALLGRDPVLSGERAFLLAAAGRRPESSEILEALLAASATGYVDPYQKLLAQLGLGDHDAVFATLAHALDNRSRDLMLMRVDPVIDPIRTDPRFGIFMVQAGLA
jgi:DNA-binding winged helix-turn-helix (wHTH) protein/Flp pilus assembly protein TadD